MMLIHSLFIRVEAVLDYLMWSDDCVVMITINTVGMQKFRKFLQIVIYLCFFWLVFQHIMVFLIHVMEYCQLILDILIQLLSFWLLRHIILPIDISGLQSIYDIILFIIVGIKYISIRSSSTAEVSFNLSLVIAFNSIKIIISLLALNGIITFLIGTQCVRVF